ncbi:MAG: hypothetical protein KUG75_04200 [Pseudomonadales bacterium]|nr:hypothetical protein [Pseudomonadales bacterium]
MADILKFKRPSLKDKAKGKTMCNSGFHKWRIDQGKQFDVKQGKLVTIYRCSRCNASKTKLD